MSDLVGLSKNRCSSLETVTRMRSLDGKTRSSPASEPRALSINRGPFVKAPSSGVPINARLDLHKAPQRFVLYTLTGGRILPISDFLALARSLITKVPGGLRASGKRSSVETIIPGDPSKRM